MYEQYTADDIPAIDAQIARSGRFLEHYNDNLTWANTDMEYALMYPHTAIHLYNAALEYQAQAKKLQAFWQTRLEDLKKIKFAILAQTTPTISA